MDFKLREFTTETDDSCTQIVAASGRIADHADVTQQGSYLNFRVVFGEWTTPVSLGGNGQRRDAIRALIRLLEALNQEHSDLARKEG